MSGRETEETGLRGSSVADRAPTATGGEGGAVCHLIASNFAGGPEKQILELASELGARGWSVVVGSFRENREKVEVIELAKARGLATFLVDTRSPFSPAGPRQLARHLRRFEVDVLVTHGYKADLVGYLATRRSRVRQIPMVRGYTGEDWKIRLYERIDRWTLRRFPSVWCVSEATRRWLGSTGINGGRVRVLHNAVRCEQKVSPVDLRREFGFPPAARVLVAAGRLSPEKGHRHLVEALAHLGDERPPIHLVILGAGRERQSLARQIDESGLTGRVVLAGFRGDILDYIAGADLVVNPSLTEGLPNVLLEALSMKVPVVATDVGGVCEIVADGATGWLVPPGDALALARAIAAALSDPERLRAAADNGYRHVSGAFSFPHQADRFVQLCAEAVRG